MVPESEEDQMGQTKPLRRLSPGTSVSHYRIIEEIGAGGMGVVYKAEDTKLKRNVALKFLPPYLTQDTDAKQRFIQEAQAASALDHNNICAVHEIDETGDGQMFISMACYEGKNLKKRIEQGSLDVEEAVGIAVQISEGLAKAHEKGIVHRDLKPANIMLTDDGVAKIMDFGLAKLAGSTRITRTGTTMGTPAYMSPEQARGEEVDQRSDIFSLGVVLYEMITGRPPFRGEYEASILYSIVHEEPEPLTKFRPQVDPRLESIVNRALEKDADKRYESIDGLTADLVALKEGTRAGSDGIARRATSKRRFLIPAAVIVAVLVALAIVSRHGTEQGLGSNILSLLTGDSEQRSEAAWEDVFTIVVAPFWGATESAVEEGRVMQGLIESRLREGLSAEAKVRILSDAIPEAPRSQQEATVLGEELDADVIIWGEVFSLHSEVEIQPYLVALSAGWQALESSTPSLEASLSEPHQLAMRKAKAEEVSQMGLIAVALYAGYDREKALELLKLVKPRSMSSILAEARVEFSWNRRAVAESLCFEAVSMDPSDPYPYYTLGSMYKEVKRYEEAIPQLEKALALDPSHEQSRYKLALIYARQRDDKALSLYDEASSRAPDQATFLSKVGWLYIHLERYDEAIERFKQAIRLSPKDYNHYFNLGRAYDYADSVGRAVEPLRKGKELADSRASRALLCWRLARAYRQQGRYEEAIEELNEAIALQPHVTQYYRGLLAPYLALGRGDEVLEIIERAVQAHPEQGAFYAVLGTAYRRLGRPQDAIKPLKQAIRLNPDNGDIHADMAMVYETVDSIDLAILHFEEASRLGFYVYTDNWVPYKLAALYYDRGMLKEAEAEILKSIELKSDEAYSYYYLGFIYMCQHRYEEAANVFKRAGELFPGFLYYGFFRSISLHNSGKHEAGRAYLRELAQTVEGESWPNSILGFLTGGIDESTFLSHAVSDDPQTQQDRRCEANYYLAMAYLLDTEAVLKSSHPDTLKAQAFLENCLAAEVPSGRVPETGLAKAQLELLNSN